MRRRKPVGANGVSSMRGSIPRTLKNRSTRSTSSGEGSASKPIPTALFRYEPGPFAAIQPPAMGSESEARSRTASTWIASSRLAVSRKSISVSSAPLAARRAGPGAGRRPAHLLQELVVGAAEVDQALGVKANSRVANCSIRSRSWVTTKAVPS